MHSKTAKVVKYHKLLSWLIPNAILVFFGTPDSQIPIVLHPSFCYLLPVGFRSILPKSKKNSKSFGKNGELNTTLGAVQSYWTNIIS